MSYSEIMSEAQALAQYLEPYFPRDERRRNPEVVCEALRILTPEYADFFAPLAEDEAA